jgi:hypothetical protein
LAQNKSVKLCFFQEDSTEINNVVIQIECKYCDSIMNFYSDTSNFIIYDFDCNHDYLIKISHVEYYTIKDIVRFPCIEPEREYYLQRIIKSIGGTK